MRVDFAAAANSDIAVVRPASCDRLSRHAQSAVLLLRASPYVSVVLLYRWCRASSIEHVLLVHILS